METVMLIFEAYQSEDGQWAGRLVDMVSGAQWCCLAGQSSPEAAVAAAEAAKADGHIDYATWRVLLATNRHDRSRPIDERLRCLVDAHRAIGSSSHRVV